MTFDLSFTAMEQNLDASLHRSLRFARIRHFLVLFWWVFDLSCSTTLWLSNQLFTQSYYDCITYWNIRLPKTA